MTFLQSWRRFTFFDREQVKDPENPEQPFTLQDLAVVSSCGGDGHIRLAESNGSICSVDKDLAVSSFKAYEISLSHMVYVRQHNIMVTVGLDEAAGVSLLKVWHFDKFDRRGVPFCSRISKLFVNNRPERVSALAVHTSLQFTAVGFEDSTLLLYKGDITREKHSKAPQVLRDGAMCMAEGGIHGLMFYGSQRHVVLYVGTSHLILSYTIPGKDKETKFVLDHAGCSLRCWTLCDQELDNQFVVARNDGVYFYQPDCRGQCYVFEGEKAILKACGPYVLVVSKDSNTPGMDENTKMNMVTIYDIPNIYIAYSAPMPEVIDVVFEWGCFNVLTKTGKMYQLREKNTESKLDILYRKNLYDLATSLAKQLHYDEEGLANIYKQYGDYLYQKNDFDNAVKQYVRTIGRIEASYVIRKDCNSFKFLDAQRIKQLTEYLEALHKANLANKDHTTILLNCYTKLSDATKVEGFVKASGKEVFFDVDTAIRVLRSAGYIDQALHLAKMHGRHEMYLHIQLEDKKNYTDAVGYVAALPFVEAEDQMKRHGKVLLQHSPEATTALITKLCSGYRSATNPDQVDKASSDEFIHIFVNDSRRLREFLEHVIKTEPDCPPVMYNTLLELYLREHAQEAKGPEKSKRKDAVIAFLQQPEAKYELDHALILCQMNSFHPGMLLLYEKAHLLHQILQHYMDNKDFKNVIQTCRKFGSEPDNKDMWVQALWYFARNPECPIECVSELLRYIDELNILPPLMVLEILSHSSVVTLAVVRDYLLRWLKAENEAIDNDEKLMSHYQEEISRTQDIIDDLKTNGQVFQVAKCSACDHALEVPTVHFLCKHSYHMHCFESYAENEAECPSCMPENRKLKALIHAQGQSKDPYQQFKSELQQSGDSISTVADYLGKGIFYQAAVKRKSSQMSAASKTSSAGAPPSLNPFDEPINPFDE